MHLIRLGKDSGSLEFFDCDCLERKPAYIGVCIWINWINGYRFDSLAVKICIGERRRYIRLFQQFNGRQIL